MGGHVFEFSTAIGFSVVGHICVFEEEASDLIVYNIGGLLACEGVDPRPYYTCYLPLGRGIWVVRTMSCRCNSDYGRHPSDVS